ncbi:MAG: acyltransferase [Acidobacteria bacterium]|nr:acyltransferase [Acidobacteriota bacterium]
MARTTPSSGPAHAGDDDPTVALPRPIDGAAPAMGYRPALDGLRALSVAAVIAYHAGLAWIPGGFLGVEVFFVVSGFLITALMLEERESTGRLSLRGFWVRRARRLLPALVVVLAAVAVAIAVAYPDSAPDFRRDVLPALAYASNWWQISFVDVPYFAASDLPVLRHLWSLAVEEQWYLLWPLAFVALGWAARRRWRAVGALLVLASAGVMAGTWLAFVPDDEARTNLLYLGTHTRSSGLLLGAALAMLWRPWLRGRQPRYGVGGAAGDAVALVALAVVGALSAVLHPSDELLYRGGLAATTVASAACIASLVSSRRSAVRWLLSLPPLVALGRRSYGLYLWHWPVFVFAGARDSSARLLAALGVTLVVNEVSYRLVEVPFRKGLLGRLWRERREVPVVRALGAALAAVLIAAGVSAAGVRVAGTEARDVSVDASGEDVVFVAPTTTEAGAATTSGTVAPGSTADATSQPGNGVEPSTTPVAGADTGASPGTDAPSLTTLVPPRLPRRVVIVGDSQAHSIYVNRPKGIESTFDLSNGSVEGCGVYERGVGVGGANGKFRRNFANCEGLGAKWRRSAEKADAEVALVVIGAWEVLDVTVSESLTYSLGTPIADSFFVGALRRAVDEVKSTGATVALLEIACMRPDPKRSGPVPALPQRGDDSRTGRLNDLMREFAAPEGDGVYFITGPREWCTDPTVSENPSYRWDGVHVYRQGAKLILESIAQQLLALPVTKTVAP